MATPLLALLLGLLIGFLGSVPVAGPISVLVLGKGLERRYRSGLGIAAGGALAEGTYAFLAAWGVGALLEKTPHVRPAFEIASAVVLIAIGVALLVVRRGAANPNVPVAAQRTHMSFLTGFLVTSLNLTILATWSAAVAFIHSHVSAQALSGLAAAILFGIGGAAGVVSWFVGMLWIMKRHAGRLSPFWSERVPRGVGGALIVFGAVAAITAIVRR